MSNLTVLLTLIGMGLVTFGIRLSMFLLFERAPLRPGLLRALRYVPVAVLSAIVFPEVLMSGGELSLTLANPRLVAALVAIPVAWKTRNVSVTVLAGMATFWLLQFLV